MRTYEKFLELQLDLENIRCDILGISDEGGKSTILKNGCTLYPRNFEAELQGGLAILISPKHRGKLQN